MGLRVEGMSTPVAQLELANTPERESCVALTDIGDMLVRLRWRPNPHQHSTLSSKLKELNQYSFDNMLCWHDGGVTELHRRACTIR